MVKIGGSKKTQIKQQQKPKLNENRGTMYTFCGNGEKFINFAEIGGNYKSSENRVVNMHNWLRGGLDAPV